MLGIMWQSSNLFISGAKSYRQCFCSVTGKYLKKNLDNAYPDVNIYLWVWLLKIVKSVKVVPKMLRIKEIFVNF